jgi:hypothetical protein
LKLFFLFLFHFFKLDRLYLHHSSSVTFSPLTLFFYYSDV